MAIPNGYDPDDFPATLAGPPPDADRLTVTYAGTVFNLTSPRGFLGAVRRLHAEAPELARRLRVRFLGRITETERDGFAGLEALGVECAGYVPHGEVTQALAASHLALCILDEVPGVERIYPAKIFELGHLSDRTGVEVITLSPPGALADLVRAHHIGPLLAPRDEIRHLRAVEGPPARLRGRGLAAAPRAVGWNATIVAPWRASSRRSCCAHATRRRGRERARARRPSRFAWGVRGHVHAALAAPRTAAAAAGRLGRVATAGGRRAAGQRRWPTMRSIITGWPWRCWVARAFEPDWPPGPAAVPGALVPPVRRRGLDRPAGHGRSRRSRWRGCCWSGFAGRPGSWPGTWRCCSCCTPRRRSSLAATPLTQMPAALLLLALAVATTGALARPAVWRALVIGALLGAALLVRPSNLCWWSSFRSRSGIGRDVSGWRWCRRSSWCCLSRPGRPRRAT